MERQAARPSAADLHSSEMTVGGRCRPDRLGAGATSVDLDVYSATHVQLARCCHVVPERLSSPRAGGSALAGNSDFYGGATPRDDGPRFMRSQGRLRETRLKPQEAPPSRRSHMTRDSDRHGCRPTQRIRVSRRRIELDSVPTTAHPGRQLRVLEERRSRCARLVQDRPRR